MFTDDDLLPLSALEHLVYCERQAALIHLERSWAENRFTAEGRVLHERADSGERESRGGQLITRGLPLASYRHGLAGRADVVEWHAASGDEPGALLPGRRGRWRPEPVEYKRGRARLSEGARIQLCAQALCLEEMLAVSIPAGALYRGATRRREVVPFDTALRQRTEAAAARLHEVLRSRETPPPVADARCEGCSLIEICLPHAPARSARGYLARALSSLEKA